MAARLRVVHVYLSMFQPGGVETLLDVHRRLDGEAGLDSSFRLLFERKAPPAVEERYYSFNFHWWQPLGWLRRKFARVMAANQGAVVVHHNCWGMPFLASADASSRRLALLHANDGFFGEFLPMQRGFFDGVMCVSPFGVEQVTRVLPEISGERVGYIPLPITPPLNIFQARRATGRPLRLGYAGRLREDQKRVDRIPLFLREAKAAGIDLQFEIVGVGWHRERLERALAGVENVKLLGWRAGSDYWTTLSSWDGILFFSDIEGGPISMLEGMAAGAIPFFPQIGGALADSYAPQIDAACYYPPGDMRALVHRVKEVFTRSESNIERLREKARTLSAQHNESKYVEAYANFATRVTSLPRISKAPVAKPRWRAAHWLPLGLVTRACRGLLRQP